MEPRNAYNTYKNIALAAVSHNADLTITKKKNIFTVKCKECNYICKYRVNDANMIYILKDSEHTCYSSNTDSKHIFFPYMKEAVVQADLSIRDPTGQQIRSFISKELLIKEDDISLTQVYSAIRSVRKVMFTNDSIDLLVDFAEKFNQMNQGRVELLRNESDELSGIFIEYNHAEAYSNMQHRLLFLDGTHTRSGFNSCILVLAGETGFETVLPLSILWCLSEDMYNTEELFARSKRIIKNNPVIKSDGAACFESAIHNHGCSHSLCIHHLIKKLKLRASSIIRDMQNASTITEFNSLCDELAAGFPKTWTSISDKLDHYFRMAGEPPTYMYKASSPIESVNAAIVNAREKRFTEMVEELIIWGDKQLTKIKQQVREAVRNQQILTTRAQKEIGARTANARENYHYKLYESFAYVVPNSVSCDRDRTNIVTWKCNSPPHHKYYGKPRGDFQARFVKTEIPKNTLWCTCQEFTASGLPCIHQCLVYRKTDIETVTSSFWKVNEYMRFMDVHQHVIPSIESLAIVPLTPAVQKPQPGRPKRSRLISIMELEKERAKETSIKQTLKSIESNGLDVEYSTYDLNRSMDLDEIDEQSFVCLLASNFNEIQRLVLLLDNVERKITNRAKKRIEYSHFIRNYLRELDEFLYDTAKRYEDAILRGSIEAYEIPKMSLCNRIAFRNTMTSESLKSILNGRKSFYNLISKCITCFIDGS